MADKLRHKAGMKGSQRQLATVIDLNKCMGCQSCTVACKNIWTQRPGTEHMRWANVATYPGRGYPRDWQSKGGGYDAQSNPAQGELINLVDAGDNLQFNHDAVFHEENGQSAHLQPTTSRGEKPQWGYNWDEDQASGSWPNAFFFYIPRKCNHCSNAPCIEACSRNAISKREDGIVLIDQDRCTGHRHCVEACPYKMVYFNPVTKRSEKCIECFPRVEQGIAPACNRQCVGRTRAYGYLDDEDNQVHKLVKRWKVALPLHPECGTEPNVFYVPPMSTRAYDESGRLTQEMRIPMEILESYFGPAVGDALNTLVEQRQRRKRGESSELMDILISRRWEDRFAQFTNEPV
ncbi:MAG: respiratory nitrate reductase subunit beta [Pseudomonadales bacterium]|jgi:DMSO reductase family type II enzyme iron-sulfur subunit|nr:respiratory nitrate reductase subunit beta [Pseudomonadales bacterium]MDP6471034.1 respiratory nitrate reductase subunit beta [Pseudomonadales bacterium]MDP6825780.1 respiratory nitrate reductase subunit beta [Pseudomonadales bacterium]MDP6970226.1 respiratory nitrate reductase subunit beta [Pseudomonadales bacterium]|tara:strand:- start:5376 stop:6419 length:1044 start_codon:yes stop_codon:yes gene_type:complete